MTRKNILKSAWTLFLFGFGCATNYNDFDKRIYIVEGLKKQNIQEEKIPEKRKPNGLSQLQLVTIQEEIGIPNLLLEKPNFRMWNSNSEISILKITYT
ncbi:hypothetical protein LEP1GSC133_0575 [Leptospira borgpetersenii serovar Pomona str. 200901868]|uniref:Lipoprotein n=1 Tax=Leptospira borgpetersenii serovar Pomona str. 200901868 TaxID=1192866 RepID=M6VU04_LEPBO|nr:hypothetical protein LEP1GSC133_0575 [Leptospira borgpetersenii serovar Pomona str. 200901868]